MKPKRIILAGASAASLVAAAVIPPSGVTDWFAQSFDGLDDGTSFTGTQGGASGGAWETIDPGVATVQTVAGRKCIDVDTSLGASASDIRFTADKPASGGIERFEFSLCAEPMPWYPLVPSSDKGALQLMANDGGLLTFGAYVVGGMSGRWITLYGHGFTQHSREWIDCRAEFNYGGSANVSFYAKLDGDEYQPLADADGNTRFTLVGTRATALAFAGKGAIGAFAGTCVTYATTENVWKGTDGGDWGVASNWTLGKVPGVGDIAVIGNGKVVRRTVGGQTADIRTWADTKFVLDEDSLSIESGDVQLFGDYTSWGTIVVAPQAKLRAQGTFYGIEMGYASTLQIHASTNVVVTTKPLCLDGVILNLPTQPSEHEEALALAFGPYGSGGDLLKLTVAGTASNWSGAWHGKLDGTTRLWIVNSAYMPTPVDALWKTDAWGNLADTGNWSPAYGERAAAFVGRGQAHVNQWDTFRFSRYFSVGTNEVGSGAVDMSGGNLLGNAAGAAVVVGKGDGNGALDIVGGVVRPTDHLWNYALSVGADSHATGTVKVRGGLLDASNGGVSVGAAGAAQMEICEGRAVAGGPFAVGYAGVLEVTGGSLILSNAVYIGRATRDEKYDVTMTVNGGRVVQSGTDESFCVGSYGGVGSKALLTLTEGDVRVARQLVCGDRRSACVDMSGGTLVAPEICVGRNLIDSEDEASFNLLGGRVETAGFTAGAHGVRQMTLVDGELVATAANDDFFQGLDLVRLDGAATIVNEADVTVKAGLIGPGGFIKTGAGTFKASGYAAWSGKTTVQAGTLDMDGGMILGEIEIAEGASVVNAKYDDIDSLSMNGDVWKSGNASTMPYLSVSKDLTAQSSSIMKATGGDGVLKGAVTFVADDDGLAFAGWTPFGWVKLGFADGTSVVVGQTYSVAMKFDFDRKGGNGKGYVFYYVYRDDTQERLVSEDGLSAFPVAGALSVKTFDGFGLQMKIDEALVARWKGGVYGKWTDTANWSTGSVPAGGMRAFVDTPATIDVAGANLANPIALLVANARVTLTGGALKFTGSASGAGMLVLSNATLKAGDLQLPVVSAAGTQNAIEGTSARLYGVLRGEGDISVEADLQGDTSAFAGRLNLVDGSLCSSEATQNGRSAWNVSGFPFGVGDLSYEFGALSGSFEASASDAHGVTLVVGARDENCSLGGSWLAGSGSGLEWTAKTATMTYEVENTAFLRLSGGGKVAVNANAGVPAALAFVGNGGEFVCGPAVDTDVSGVLAPSTAPVTFNDGGVDRVWAHALTAPNVMGLVKRGAGTLTLGAVPSYSGETVVEEGVLVVPYGTRLDAVTVERAGKIVIDLENRAASGVALAIGRSNRDLTLFAGRYFSVTNQAAGFEYEIRAIGNNGLVVLRGSEDFVWTGAVDTAWTNAANWTVDGEPATRAPSDQDSVLFENEAVVLIDDARAYSLAGTKDLSLIGTNATLTVVGAMNLTGGQLTLAGKGIAIQAAEAVLSSLSGTGTVHVASGSLELSSVCSSKFVGTLNVTNLVKAGDFTFEYEPLVPFVGTLSVACGMFRWNCVEDMTNETSVVLSMSASARLDLCGGVVTVAGFTGAGEVSGGTLLTVDGVITQSGGPLVIPAAEQTVYVLSRASEPLQITGASGKLVEIVVPRTWFVAGVSGKNAVFCESSNIIWNILTRAAVAPKNEGNGWWSIAGGGFTVRLK